MNVNSEYLHYLTQDACITYQIKAIKNTRQRFELILDNSIAAHCTDQSNSVFLNQQKENVSVLCHIKIQGAKGQMSLFYQLNNHLIMSKIYYEHHLSDRLELAMLSKRDTIGNPKISGLYLEYKQITNIILKLAGLTQNVNNNIIIFNSTVKINTEIEQSYVLFEQVQQININYLECTYNVVVPRFVGICNDIKNGELSQIKLKGSVAADLAVGMFITVNQQVQLLDSQYKLNITTKEGSCISHTVANTGILKIKDIVFDALINDNYLIKTSVIALFNLGNIEASNVYGLIPGTWDAINVNTSSNLQFSLIKIVDLTRRKKSGSKQYVFDSSENFNCTVIQVEPQQFILDRNQYFSIFKDIQLYYNVTIRSQNITITSTGQIYVQILQTEYLVKTLINKVVLDVYYYCATLWCIINGFGLTNAAEISLLDSKLFGSLITNGSANYLFNTSDTGDTTKGLSAENLNIYCDLIFEQPVGALVNYSNAKFSLVNYNLTLSIHNAAGGASAVFFGDQNSTGSSFNAPGALLIMNFRGNWLNCGCIGVVNCDSIQDSVVCKRLPDTSGLIFRELPQQKIANSSKTFTIKCALDDSDNYNSTNVSFAQVTDNSLYSHSFSVFCNQTWFYNMTIRGNILTESGLATSTSAALIGITSVHAFINKILIESNLDQYRSDTAGFVGIAHQGAYIENCTFVGNIKTTGVGSAFIAIVENGQAFVVDCVFQLDALLNTSTQGNVITAGTFGGAVGWLFPGTSGFLQGGNFTAFVKGQTNSTQSTLADSTTGVAVGIDEGSFVIQGAPTFGYSGFCNISGTLAQYPSATRRYVTDTDYGWITGASITGWNGVHTLKFFITGQFDFNGTDVEMTSTAVKLEYAGAFDNYPVYFNIKLSGILTTSTSDTRQNTQGFLVGILNQSASILGCNISGSSTVVEHSNSMVSGITGSAFSTTLIKNCKVSAILEATYGALLVFNIPVNAVISLINIITDGEVKSVYVSVAGIYEARDNCTIIIKNFTMGGFYSNLTRDGRCQDRAGFIAASAKNVKLDIDGLKVTGTFMGNMYATLINNNNGGVEVLNLNNVYLNAIINSTTTFGLLGMSSGAIKVAAANNFTCFIDLNVKCVNDKAFSIPGCCT